MNQSGSSRRFVARASAALLKAASTSNLITAALVLSACVVTAAAQSDIPAFAKFKSEMMPKVGQTITVVGTLSAGKQPGFWLSFNNWGVYIHTAKESGVEKENDLYAHFRSGQTVRVTGTLKHFEPTATGEEKRHAQSVQRPPEDFFFDAADVEMVLLAPPVTKNPKKQGQ